MNRIHLVVLWHMHQPQYRDPETGRYVLPWTRLHALKDYYGMVELLREFTNFHATFNIVPALGAQLEEYASGKFNEPWFSLAFKSADELTREDKSEILSRAFQVNHEHLMSRWPRLVELYEWSRPAGGAQALIAFTARDWRDLQLLSQLVWMEESWFQKNEVVSRLAAKGKDYTENDKSALRGKQLELLRLILPAYRDAASRGQIEISTTPFYHPILPLLCDSDIARVANPSTPLPRRAFRRPEDAREQLQLARQYHEKTFGLKPPGLWPSEGSVSDQALSIAAEEGFQWFGTDEGVLGRTLNVGFFRDSGGIPANADRLFKPWRIHLGDKSITGLFRDHHLSDLIGFVYSRMEAKAAAADIPSSTGIFPASWINANFDVWIGHSEDVTAWELLWDTREVYARGVEAYKTGRPGAPTETALKQAHESLLAAEGSDWCWWFGPEHSTANDAEFDALYRKHLTEIYLALGQVAPEELAKPIKRRPEHAFQLAPTGFLRVKVDGRESSYFEWLGAGLYSPERRGGSMHGRVFYLHEMRYGFEEDRFCIRIDHFAEAMSELEDPEFRITVGGAEELVIVVKLQRGRIQEFAVEKARLCLLRLESVAVAAFDRILEAAIHRDQLDLKGQSKLRLGVALWHGGLPVDVLPAEGLLDIQLGEDNFAWPPE